MYLNYIMGVGVQRGIELFHSFEGKLPAALERAGGTGTAEREREEDPSTIAMESLEVSRLPLRSDEEEAGASRQHLGAFDVSVEKVKQAAVEKGGLR